MFWPHKKLVTMWGDECINELVIIIPRCIHSLNHVHLYKKIMLYNLNIFNICQSYIKKSGKRCTLSFMHILTKNSDYFKSFIACKNVDLLKFYVSLSQLSYYNNVYILQIL